MSDYTEDNNDFNEGSEIESTGIARLAFPRTVTLRTTQRTSPVVISSDAATFGQLREDINSADAGIAFSGTTSSIVETGTSVTGPHSMLPEGDFTIMQFPAKNDNG